MIDLTQELYDLGAHPSGLLTIPKAVLEALLEENRRLRALRDYDPGNFAQIQKYYGEA